MTQHDPTEFQSNEDQQRALELSLKRSQPPLQVPGYRIEKFLGSGAYGEVWVAVDENTGREVAIKFYTHRGGVDWSLLSREVEKLVVLSADRYVVQLLDVGWDAEPPYYVMEFISQGSLGDQLERGGPLPLDEALELFRELATGLARAHGKGVLHCDLKPANVLLDEDSKPRLADFGQSRLSNEQTPSLGTLFYMAPEQADLEAVPDARWDVYALGAILYCALTGEPPYRDEQAVAQIDEADGLENRLATYRHVLRNCPRPSLHRKVPNMDRSLAAIIDRCLSTRPQDRFATVQDLLNALVDRDRQRARRPLVLLGFLGPLLFLLITGLIGWQVYTKTRESKVQELILGSKARNYFAAKAVASKAGYDIAEYFRAAEQVAALETLQSHLASLQADERLTEVLAELADPGRNDESVAARARLLECPEQRAMQELVEEWIKDRNFPTAASWFVCDLRGTQLAAAFADPEATSTVGRNYGWRTYFHGGADDLVKRDAGPDGEERLSYTPPPGMITRTHLSSPFQSRATQRWKVAISTPIRDAEGKPLGVVALTADIGLLLRFEEGSENFLATLVDGRRGARRGMILHHRLFDQLAGEHEPLPARFSDYLVDLNALVDPKAANLYNDPFGEDPLGAGYQKRWVAAKADVELELGPRDARGRRTPESTGLIVVVQQDYESLIEPVQHLGTDLLWLGGLGLVAVIGVVGVLWFIVLRAMQSPLSGLGRRYRDQTVTPIHEISTVAFPRNRPKR